MCFHFPRRCYLKRLRWETMCYITKSFFGNLSCFPHELMKIHCRPERNPKHRGRNITSLLFLKPVFIQGCHTRGREPRWRRSWTWRQCSCASSSSSSSATSPGSSSTATSFSPVRRSSGEQISDLRFFYAVRQDLKFWLNTTFGGICLYLKTKLIDPDVTPLSTFRKKIFYRSRISREPAERI